MIFLALLWSAGCGGEEQLSGAAETAVPIINGSPAGASYPEVGKLRIETKEGIFLCSGTLIAPDMVLTSAHCFPEGTKNIIFFIDWPVAGPGRPAPKTVYIYGSSFLLHPEYEKDKMPNYEGNDIALLFLASPVPYLRPASISYEPTKNDQEIIMVGYGKIDANDERSAGKKYTATAAIKAVGDYFYDIELDAASGHGSICGGDSGGPSFDKKTGKIVGMHALGTEDCRYGEDLRIDRHKEWLKGGYAEDEKEGLKYPAALIGGCSFFPPAGSGPLFPFFFICALLSISRE